MPDEPASDMPNVDGIPDLETPVEELVDAMPDVPDVMPETPEPEPKSKRAGKSNRNIPYVCSRCAREVGRENLVVQRVQYLEIGVGGKLLKTRTVGWVCRNVEDNCLDKDKNWTADRYTGTPGLADTSRA